MCNEGGCGACIVSASALHPVNGKLINFGVNSVRLLNIILDYSVWYTLTSLVRIIFFY